MIFDGGGQANLFDGNDLLILAELTLFLGLLEAILAVVHELANRRTGLRRDLDKVKLPLLCQGQRVPAGHDAQLFAVLIHDAHLAVANLLVNHEIVDTETPPKSVRAMKKEQRIAPLCKNPSRGPSELSETVEAFAAR